MTLKHPQLQNKMRHITRSNGRFWISLAILLALAFLHSPVHAEGPDLVWTLPVVTDSFDEVRGVCTQDGHVYIAGTTSGRFPSNTSSGGDSDAFVSEIGPDGYILWIRQFGTAGLDRAYDVTADATAIYTVGSTTGIFYLEGQSNTGNNQDAFIRKFTPAGKHIWTRQFGTSGSDEARAIALDATGLYVTGVIVDQMVDGNITRIESDAFIRKYDFDGNLIWEDRIGTVDSEQALDIAAGPSGVYVTGTTNGRFPGQDFVAGGQDGFIRKYNLEGKVLWSRQFGTSDWDSVSGIDTDSSNVYVVGATAGTLPGQAGFGGAMDAFVISFDFEGNELWSDQFGTGNLDEARDLDVSGSSIFITGTTQGSFKGYTNSGDNLDTFLVRYTTGGFKESTLQLGTPGIDQSFGLTGTLDRLYQVGAIGGAFASQSEGYVTSLDIPAVQDAGIAPAPTPLPTPTLIPTVVPTPSPTPIPSVPIQSTATPVPGQEVVPVPTPSPSPTPFSGQVQASSAASSTEATPVQPLPVMDYPPPSSSRWAIWKFLLLAFLGIIFVVAVVGTVRNW